MNTMDAIKMKLANLGNETMVFDWDKAARLIKENGAKEALAGLRGDWEWTGGVIYSGGKIITNDYTYLASIWAVPELQLDKDAPIPCYVMKHETKWDEHTKWPKSARLILEGG